MGLIAQAWAVARLEVLRFLRWRGYWDTLLRWCAGVMTAMLALLWLGVPLGEGSLGSVIWSAGLAAPGIVGWAVIERLVGRMFSDETPRGAAPDVYLTGAHPLSIVWGRLIAAWLLSGVGVLATLPLVALAIGVGGLAVGAVVGGVWLSWWMTLWLGAMSARLQARAFPFLETPPPPQKRSTIGLVWGVFWIYFVGSMGGAAGWQRVHESTLLYGLAPPLTALELLRLNATISLPLGVGMWLGLFGLALTLVPSFSVAYRQGWDTASALRLRRGVGSGVLLGILGLQAWQWASAVVYLPLDAARFVFGGIVVGAFTAYWLGQFEFGFFTPPRLTTPQRLAPPLDGLLRAGALATCAALMMWLIVGATTGYWVAPLHALGMLFYTLCLLLLFQSLNTRDLLRLRQLHARPNTFVPQAERLRYEAPINIGCIVAIGAVLPLLVLVFGAPFAPLEWLRRHVLIYTPLGAFGVEPIWKYGLYGLYALAVAGVVGWIASRGRKANS